MLHGLWLSRQKSVFIVFSWYSTIHRLKKSVVLCYSFVKGGVNVTAKECGDFIAELRKENELTQKELAERINVSDKAVSRWETGVSHS